MQVTLTLTQNWLTTTSLAGLAYTAQLQWKSTTYRCPLKTVNFDILITTLDMSLIESVTWWCFQCQVFDCKMADYPFSCLPSLQNEISQMKRMDICSCSASNQYTSNANTTNVPSTRHSSLYYTGCQIQKYQIGQCKLPNCRLPQICRVCKEKHRTFRCGAAGCLPFSYK